MLLGKALAYLQRLVCTPKMLGWYCVDGDGDGIFTQKRSSRKVKHTVKITLAFLFVALLAACSTPEQIAERDRQNQYRAQLAQQAYVERLAGKCDSYGFQRGTTAFAQCMQQVEQQQSIENAMQNAAALQAFSAIQQQQQSQQLLQQQQIQNLMIKPIPSNTPIQTQCYKNGMYINCTSQ